MNDLISFEIYFNDLNEDAQKRLLEAVNVKEPRDMNWDINMCPLSIYQVNRNVTQEESDGNSGT